MKILIVDDELNCRVLLENQVKTYCTNTAEILLAKGVAEGIELINTFQPDIVFLDIQMTDGTGFDLLNSFTRINFKLIFTTAFDEYAVKAFKYSAVHYLLKPIASEELKEAFDRSQVEYSDEDMIINQIAHYTQGDFNVINLRTHDNFHKVRVTDIECIEADGAYCIFRLPAEKSILVSKPMKEYVQLLPPSQFMKIHKTYLVNLDEIAKYNYGSSEVILTSGKKIPVSRRNKSAVLSILNKQKSVVINRTE